MNIQSVNSYGDKLNFGARIHNDTIRHIAGEIVSSKISQEDTGVAVLKDCIKRFVRLGDSETRIAMEMPEKSHFIFDNPKLGTSNVKIQNRISNTEDTIYLLKPGATMEDLQKSMSVLEQVDNLSYFPEKIQDGEVKLFRKYMDDMYTQKGMSPIQVLDELRAKGAFSEEYLGENGIFTNAAKAQDKAIKDKKKAIAEYNMQQAELLRINNEIEDFIKNLG